MSVERYRLDGARVGEDGLLVAAPARRESVRLGGEAVPGGGLALERGQVVEERRGLALLARPDLGHAPGPARPSRRSRRPPRRRPCRVAEPGTSGRRSARPSRPARTRRRRSSTGRASNAWISCSRRTSMARVGVCTRPIEYSASCPARGRAVSRARRVHADEPVGLRARARRHPRAPRSRARPQRREAAADRLVGQRRDPQRARSAAALPRVLVDVAEDQLALAPGVARVDDARDVVPLDELRIAVSWSLPEAPSARGTTSKCSGRIGRSSMRHFLKRRRSLGIGASSARWPTAHVTSRRRPRGAWSR